MDINQPNSNDNNDDQVNLGSTEYRTKLLTKLNCLVAVLEVAITKISRSMELPTANQERLGKIKANLDNTLSICTRAKTTLEKTMSGDTGTAPAKKLTTSQKHSVTSDPDSMSYRDYVELSSIEEYQKFKKLAPINTSDLKSADIDGLLRQLYDS